MTTTKNSSTWPALIKLGSSDAQNELITMGERWAVANQRWRLIAGLFSDAKTTLRRSLRTAGILLIVGFRDFHVRQQEKWHCVRAYTKQHEKEESAIQET